MDLLFPLEILRLILLPSTLWKVFLFWSTIYQGLKNYPYIYWHINVRKCTIWRQSQTSVCRENSCFANNVGGICTNGKQSDAMPPGYVETNVTSPCNVIPQVCIYIQSTCTLKCAVLWSKTAILRKVSCCGWVSAYFLASWAKPSFFIRQAFFFKTS